MKKIATLFFAALTLLCISASAQDQESINREIFQKTFQQVKDKADLPIGDLTIEIAKTFLGTDYVAGTLEIEPEALQVFLDKTDCILFVELSSCFALTVKGWKIVQGHQPVKAEPSYELLCDNIRNMRYRKGVVNGYSSRVHYTSEWLIQNHNNNIVNEYTSELGKVHPQTFSYMTDHTGSYKQLQHNPAEAVKVRRTEKWLDKQGPYYIITQEELRKPEVISKIKDGDIITFIDTHKGLDLAHVALAYTAEDGQMHFIHASYGAKHVIIEPKTLADYARNGIRISRLVER